MAPFDPAFFDPFVAATIRTLKLQCNTESHLEKMGLAETVSRVAVDIAGVIGFTGKEFQGAMTISFPRAVFLHLMSQMLQEKCTEITNKMADGAAELSNIIFGHAKLGLNSKGYEIKMAFPSVMIGDELSSGAPITSGASVLKLMTPAGPVVIELAGKCLNADEANPSAPTPAAEADVAKLNAHVLMSFVNGMRQTFKMQCSAEAVALTPFLKTSENAYQFDIGSLIGVTGATFGGSIAICFQKSVFLAVLEKMLGEKVIEITPEMENAATEIMNIAFGVAKQVLNAEGYALRMAIPTVIRGRNVQSLYPSRRPPIVLPFRMFEGLFWAEFALDPDTRN